MNLAELNLAWFDGAVLLLLWVGLIRGRTKGVSSQLLELLQWLGTVFLGVLLYRPIGHWLQPHLQVSSVAANVIAFLLIGGLLKLAIARLEDGMSEKLLSGDYFGRMEYPLGMLAGVLIHAAMILAALSLTRARLVTTEEVNLARKKQLAELGSTFFPDLGKVQEEIFEKSMSGKFIHQHLGQHLIQPVRYEPFLKAEAAEKKKARDPVEEIITATAKK